MNNPLVQISRCYSGSAGGDSNQIHISIIRETGVHIRVALSPEQFAEALFAGTKIEGKIVRWNISEQ